MIMCGNVTTTSPGEAVVTTAKVSCLGLDRERERFAGLLGGRLDLDLDLDLRRIGDLDRDLLLLTGGGETDRFLFF